jgi:hypothetical protein
MKYIEALKKYNEGSDKWCMPRKGTEDYFKIINLMNKISNIKKSTDGIKSNDKEVKIKALQAAIKRRLILNKNNSKDNKGSENSKQSLKYISNISKKFSVKPQYNSSQHVFSKDIENKNGKIIKNFIMDKVKTNRYKLINRINRFKLLKNKIALLKYNDCLEKKVFNGVQGYTIRNIINLIKRIGSKSKYGSIYLTSIPNTIGPHPIATKIMKNDNDNILEINIMTKITYNIILKKLSKHFLMIYGSCTCSGKIAEKLRLISINELADGDLKMLLTVRELLQNEELLLNLLFQTFISIATYHNLVGYVHGDSHYGNYLYQQNNEVGYYHYVFNGNDYYLKSCKWNIIIFDYGFSKKINNVNNAAHVKKINKDLFEDYRRIIHAFMNKKSGWGEYRNLPNDQINNMILEIASCLDRIIYLELTSQVVNLSKTFAITLFKSIIDNVFLKYTPKDMFITTRPPNVINETPFIIG